MLDVGFKIFHLKKNKDQGNIAYLISQTPVTIKALLILINVWDLCILKQSSKIIYASILLLTYDTFCIMGILGALAEFTNQSCVCSLTKRRFITFMGTTACMCTVLEISPCFKWLKTCIFHQRAHLNESLSKHNWLIMEMSLSDPNLTHSDSFHQIDIVFASTAVSFSLAFMFTNTLKCWIFRK